MEIAVQVLKHLPAGGPRILAVIVIGLLFFFPEMRRLFTKRHREKDRYEQLNQLLELRKLELTVADLKAKHPEAKNENVDSQIEEIFREAESDNQSEPETTTEDRLNWIERLKFSLAGSFALMILGSVPLVFSGRFQNNADILKVFLVELSLAILCGFLASAIPGRRRWECVFRGFLIPALLGALTVAAKGNM